MGPLWSRGTVNDMVTFFAYAQCLSSAAWKLFPLLPVWPFRQGQTTPSSTKPRGLTALPLRGVPTPVNGVAPDAKLVIRSMCAPLIGVPSPGP